MPAIVLMSTHDGSAFIEQQMRSILEQSYRDIRIVVRDDGSTDGTPELLRSFVTDPRIELIAGSRLGLPHAFFELVRIAPVDAEAYFFCDQDDVWHRDKVSIAIAQLADYSATLPTLYCSRLNLMTSDMRPISTSPDWAHAPSLGNALVENICTGCTVAFNQAAHNLVRTTLPASGIIHHDWWLYLVISAFGKVIFDRVPHIDHRLHQGNAVGIPTTQLDNHIRRFANGSPTRRISALLRQAQTFAEIYREQLPNDARRTLDEFLAIANIRSAALPLVVNHAIHRQRKCDDMLWRISLLLRSVGAIKPLIDEEAR